MLINVRPASQDQYGPRPAQFFQLDDKALAQLQLGKVLQQGLGDQLGFHVYDSPQMFSLSLPAHVGDADGHVEPGRSDQ